MDNKQENLDPVLPEAVMPTENSSELKQDMNYDFNFKDQVVGSVTPVTMQEQSNTTNPSGGIADPAIGQVNPNPVMPDNIVPIEVDTAAGATIVKPIIKPVDVTPVQSNIITSGTATEEEIIIDASKGTAEVLDEFVITMDAAAEKSKEKNNNIFIGVVFGVIILFIILLKVIINIVGY